MPSQMPGPLVEAVARISAQVAENRSNVGDLFERIIESLYSKVVRPGDTAIDGGAHTGRHTIPLAHLVGTGGTVLAFEPLPSAAQQLQQLLARCGLDEIVQLRTAALAREPGRHAFFIVNNMLEFSGLTKRPYVDFTPDQTGD